VFKKSKPMVLCWLDNCDTLRSPLLRVSRPAASATVENKRTSFHRKSQPCFRTEGSRHQQYRLIQNRPESLTSAFLVEMCRLESRSRCTASCAHLPCDVLTLRSSSQIRPQNATRPQQQDGPQIRDGLRTLNGNTTEAKSYFEKS
jgi:hypothetical protein